MRIANTTFLVAVLAFGIALPASAEENRWMERKAEMMNALDLNEAQKNELGEIRAKYSPQMRNLRKQRRQMRKDLSHAMKTDADESELRKIHGQMQEVRMSSGNLRFEKMLEVRKVLNADQRGKYFEMRRSMRKRHRPER